MLVKKPGRVLGRIGDVNPFEYGGGVIYAGPNGPELWWTHGLDGEGSEDSVEVYRVDLGRTPNIFLSDYNWVNWKQIGDFADFDQEDFQDSLQTVLGRALLLELAMSYHGGEAFDHYPETYTHGQLGRRHW